MDTSKKQNRFQTTPHISPKHASHASSKLQAKKEKQRDPFVRAANEDDDGYDPWSDRKASDPLWEKDPWR